MITKTKFNQAPLNKIKIENRVFLVSKLETGDLIKTKAETYPLIFHYGIVEKNLEGLFIIHNHPDKINSKGGNTVRETLEKWIKGRDIVSIEKTDLKTDDIEKLYQELKKYKYDFLNFNCEHFVNFAKNRNYVSPQVLRWTTLALIGLGIYFLLKNKRI
jgi:hypothetical protein